MARQFGSRVARLPSSEYRAVDGAIGITNTNDGSYSTISATEARKRMKELVEESKRIIQIHPGSAEDLRSFFYELEQVIREAEEQGPPEVPDMLRERVRRRPSSIFIPSKHDIAIINGRSKRASS